MNRATEYFRNKWDDEGEPLMTKKRVRQQWRISSRYCHFSCKQAWAEVNGIGYGFGIASKQYKINGLWCEVDCAYDEVGKE